MTQRSAHIENSLPCRRLDLGEDARWMRYVLEVHAVVEVHARALVVQLRDATAHEGLARQRPPGVLLSNSTLGRDDQLGQLRPRHERLEALGEEPVRHGEVTQVRDREGHVVPRPSDLGTGAQSAVPSGVLVDQPFLEADFFGGALEGDGRAHGGVVIEGPSQRAESFHGLLFRPLESASLAPQRLSQPELLLI
eukprot:CAMPEP_0197444384 /NCGR_PEP_ID=MMETSP1175-20131217/9886_1 /TAXON_ID=1003142 /ORGANISM="Triceratium dubium, Strain CCMP147" /LENGTH=193 /DNA_ID=CAMNT_0042975165 /DNA_START=59 /DNA_END=640 /DNA_ORIENTATION=-